MCICDLDVVLCTSWLQLMPMFGTGDISVYNVSDYCVNKSTKFTLMDS